MALYLPQRWRRPPPLYARTNWGHPLARGLVEFTQVYSGGLLTSDGLWSTQQGATAVELAFSKSGMGRRSRAVSSISYESAPLRRFTADKTPGNGVTLYARVRVDAIGEDPSNYDACRCIYGITFSGTVGIGIASASLTAHDIAGGVNLGANRPTAPVSVTLGVEYDVFLTHPGIGADLFTIEVLGVGTATSTAFGTWTLSTQTLSNPAVRTGFNGSSGNGADKTLIVGAFWQRALARAEKYEIASNPWQLLAPMTTQRNFFVAGATPTATGQFFHPLLNNQAWF